MKKNINNSQSGFSLLESITAAAIFIIGIIGINAMVSMSNRVVEKAAIRDQITLTSSMALEDMVSNPENAHEYKTANCYEADNGANKRNKDKNRWFKIMQERKIGKIKDPKKCIVETEQKTIKDKNGEI